MRFGFLVIALAVVPAMAPAQEAAQDSRFQIEREGDRIVRLDTKTGTMSVCTMQDDQLDCRMAADERAALQAEIDRLAQEVDQLRTARGEDAPETGLSKDGKELTLKLPSEEDIRGAVAFFEDMLQRFVAAVKDLAGDAV